MRYRYTSNFVQLQREPIQRIIESGGSKAANDVAVWTLLNAWAQWEPTTYRGLLIDRGQVFVTRRELGDNLHLTDKEVRSSLDRLEKLGLIIRFPDSCIKQKGQDKGPRGGTLLTLVIYGVPDFEKNQKGQDEGPSSDEKGPREGPGEGPREGPSSDHSQTLKNQGFQETPQELQDEGRAKREREQRAKHLFDMIDKGIMDKGSAFDIGGSKEGGAHFYGVNRNIRLSDREAAEFLSIFKPEALDLISEKKAGSTVNFKYCMMFMNEQGNRAEYIADGGPAPGEQPPTEESYQRELKELTDSTTVYSVKELQEAARAVKAEYLKGERGSLRRIALAELAKRITQ